MTPATSPNTKASTSTAVFAGAGSEEDVGTLSEAVELDASGGDIGLCTGAASTGRGASAGLETCPSTREPATFTTRPARYSMRASGNSASNTGVPSAALSLNAPNASKSGERFTSEQELVPRMLAVFADSYRRVSSNWLDTHTNAPFTSFSSMWSAVKVHSVRFSRGKSEAIFPF